MDMSLLRTKFRGSLLGTLIGDCLGSPYQNDKPLTSGAKIVLQKSLDKLEGPFFKAPVIQYTDDSAMTRSLTESLVENQCFNPCDVAKKFVKNYYEEPNRGYGSAVLTVFHKLRENKFSDILGPAKEQFDGQGSLGNGGAMRVAPVALFCHNEYEKLIETTIRETEITHTHEMGINGAILQAIAIQQALQLNPKDDLDAIKFIDELITKMNDVEASNECPDFMDARPYTTQLDLVKKFLKEEGEGPHDVKVVEKLGNSVTAIQSVPTAIFCFLRAQKPIKEIHTENPLRRAIQYAISLGGDTDTIAAMTGAVAGAFYGETNINVQLLEHCEASAEFKNLSDKLYEISVVQ